jgi:hypothetical protein
MQYLALEVGEVDRIELDEPQRADASRRKIERNGRPKTTGTNEEHTRPLKCTLAAFSDLRKENVAAVANELLSREVAVVASGFAVSVHGILRSDSVAATTGR